MDFYADWCIACKEMAANTLNDIQVKQALSGLRVLQADVTANDAVDRALERYFNVIAPPTFILFNNQQHELVHYRIVGTIGPKEFLQRLRQTILQ